MREQIEIVNHSTIDQECKINFTCACPTRLQKGWMFSCRSHYDIEAQRCNIDVQIVRHNVAILMCKLLGANCSGLDNLI